MSSFQGAPAIDRGLHDGQAAPGEPRGSVHILVQRVRHLTGKQAWCIFEGQFAHPRQTNRIRQTSVDLIWSSPRHQLPSALEALAFAFALASCLPLRLQNAWALCLSTCGINLQHPIHPHVRTAGYVGGVPPPRRNAVCGRHEESPLRSSRTPTQRPPRPWSPSNLGPLPPRRLTRRVAGIDQLAVDQLGFVPHDALNSNELRSPCALSLMPDPSSAPWLGAQR